MQTPATLTPCWGSLILMWILHAAEATSAGLVPHCSPYRMPKYPISLLCIFPQMLLCELPVFAKELSPVATEAFHSLPIVAVNDPLKPNISFALVMLHPQNPLKAFSNILQIQSICSKSLFSWSWYHTWKSLVCLYPILKNHFLCFITKSAINVLLLGGFTINHIIF